MCMYKNIYYIDYILGCLNQVHLHILGSQLSCLVHKIVRLKVCPSMDAESKRSVAPQRFSHIEEQGKTVHRTEVIDKSDKQKKNENLTY